MEILDLSEMRNLLKEYEKRQVVDLDLMYQHGGAPDLSDYMRDFERIKQFSDRMRRIFRDAAEALRVIDALCRPGRDAKLDENHEIGSIAGYFDCLVKCTGKPLPEPVHFFPDEPFMCPGCGRRLVVRIVPRVISENPEPLKRGLLTGKN